MRNNPHPLFAAAAGGQVDALLALLANGAEPDTIVTTDGKTAIMAAASNGEVEAVAILIAAGADVNRLSAPGLSTLRFAAMNGSDEAVTIMRHLIQSGADVERGGPSTPLMCASANSVAAMAVLLDAGANPNAVRPLQATALHVCVHNNNVPGVELLMARGADPFAPASLTYLKPGLTSVEAARHSRRVAIAALLAQESLPVPGRDEILSRLGRLAADPAYGLRPGATEDTIAEFAETVGIARSHLLLDMYRHADGQKSGADQPIIPESDDFFGRDWLFLSLNNALAVWRDWTKTTEDGVFDGRRNLKSDPGVSRVWWASGWIPFLADENGNFVCLDIAPAATGTVGQVIQFWHDVPTRRLLGKTLESYLAESGFFAEPWLRTV
ncbi:MAG: ankyrin repeat domain-containing protein [Fimbriiglobus sp.]